MEKEFKYEIGDKVVSRHNGCPGVVERRGYYNGEIQYGVSFGNGIDFGYCKESWLKPDDYLKNKKTEEVIEDKGEVSDGYHTFNELYEYRLLYNASMFNEFAKQGMYDVHKSKRHSDGNFPFDNPDYFIVVAELPTGQISNHYRMKEWDLFDIPEKETSNPYDGHTPKDVTERLRKFLIPKKEYPKTYEECCEVLSIPSYYKLRYHTYEHGFGEFTTLNKLCSLQDKLNILSKLLICRDAYWKIAGQEMGLGKSWEPDNDHICNSIVRHSDEITKKHGWGNFNIFEFPTVEIRDAFYENFKEEIEICKELL